MLDLRRKISDLHRERAQISTNAEELACEERDE